MKPKNNILHHLGIIALAFAGFAASSAYADTALTTGHTIIDTTGNPELGVISRSTGATALFDNNGTATATGTPLVNGIVGPWAFIGTGTATSYATLDGSNNIVSSTGTTTTWGGTVNDATANYEISAAGNATYGGSERVANTIRYTGSTGSTISLGNNTAFGLTVNGLITGGTGTLTFNHGGGALLEAGIHIGATQELVIHAANAAITLSARVHDSTGGASVVTVVAPNTVTLSGASTYTGGTFVNQGTVRIGNNSALGTGAVSIASGATVNNSAVLSGLANTFTGSGTFTTSAGAGQVTVSGDWTGFSGSVQSSIAGDMVFNGGFTSAVADTTSANAAYVNNYDSTNSNGMIVQNQTGGTVTYQLGSYASAVGSNLRNSGTATGDVNLEIGNLNTSTEAAGTIGGGAQTTSLTKVGTGTLTLSGANTYTGATTVNAGILAVNGNAIADANKLVINGGLVDPLGATEVVGTLYFGTEQQPAGTYSADPLSGADFIDDVHFTGTGVVSVTTGPSAGYTAWADANGATGQTMDQDHDNDGVENGIEYFMGETGSTFTTNPAPVNGAVTWPMGAAYTGVYGTDYEVQYSTNLVDWTKVDEGTGDNTVSVTPGISVVYDMPTGDKSFVRMAVNN